jgi:hypothetical protein
MRVMTIAQAAMAVSPDQEARWPRLAAEALEASARGDFPVPTVWFRTDAGVVGSIPVTEHVSVGFADEEDPAGFIGTIVLLGPEAGRPE